MEERLMIFDRIPSLAIRRCVIRKTTIILRWGRAVNPLRWPSLTKNGRCRDTSNKLIVELQKAHMCQESTSNFLVPFLGESSKCLFSVVKTKLADCGKQK